MIMKKLLFTLVLSAFAMSAYSQTKQEVIRLSEPIIATDNYEIFGEELKTDSKEQTLTELINNEGISEEEIVVVTTEVTEVCEKKGCFFVAHEGEYSARITFKDYGFFIPTDSKNKKVTVVGTFSKKVLSEEKAKHYAEDAGKNADEIKGEQTEYSILASSVIIYKN